MSSLDCWAAQRLGRWPRGRSGPIGCGALGRLDSVVAAPIATRAFDILRALGARHSGADDNNVPEATNP